jgi:hypothetical protein
MGNIVTNNSGYPIDSALGTLINDWAINDYDAGLGYKKDESAQIKKLLKKRACCTRQGVMSISLPIIDPIVDGPECVKPGYKPVNIRIFNSNQAEMEQNCSIDNNNYLLPVNFGTTGIETDTNCKLLYEGPTENQGLCNSIKNDRSKQSTSGKVIAYGLYDNDINNVYADCNCLNSVLRNLNNFKSAYAFDDEIIVQKFDLRCSSLGNMAYKLQNKEVKTLCINIVDLNNIYVQEEGIVNLNQNCPVDSVSVDINKTNQNTYQITNQSYKPVTTSPIVQESDSGVIKTVIIVIFIILILVTLVKIFIL